MSLAKRGVIALSGGLDSTALLIHLLAQQVTVHGVSFDYGQRHRIELDRLQDNLEYLRGAGHAVDWKLVDLRDLGGLLDSALTNQARPMPLGHYSHDNMKATVVPNRNAIFASIAWGWALSLAEQHHEPVLFALGVHSGDHAIYPDCRPGFFNSLTHAFKVGNWNSSRVITHLPYLNVDKSLILQDALESASNLKLDFDRLFRNTCTSYSPDSSGKSHGLTGSDVERILAFHSIGRRDPLEYADPWEVCVERALELQQQQAQQPIGEQHS